MQREFSGTASKSKTEAMLRKAMDDYEAQGSRRRLKKVSLVFSHKGKNKGKGSNFERWYCETY